MGFLVNIYDSDDAVTPIHTLRLGTTLLEDGEKGEGEAHRLYVRNEGDITLVAANVNISGDGAHTIQLARDEAGAYGIWAQPGQGIVALADEVPPGEGFSFWARGVFTENDAPERKSFTFDLELAGRHS